MIFPQGNEICDNETNFLVFVVIYKKYMLFHFGIYHFSWNQNNLHCVIIRGAVNLVVSLFWCPNDILDKISNQEKMWSSDIPSNGSRGLCSSTSRSSTLTSGLTCWTKPWTGWLRRSLSTRNTPWVNQQNPELLCWNGFSRRSCNMVGLQIDHNKGLWPNTLDSYSSPILVAKATHVKPVSNLDIKRRCAWVGGWEKPKNSSIEGATG